MRRFGLPTARVTAQIAALIATLVAAGAQAAPATPTMVLQLHFRQVAVAGAAADDCAAVQASPRTLPRSPGVARAALQALLAGPTPEEQARGLRSPFSAATAGLLKRVFITADGTAWVDLADPGDAVPGASSSCTAAEIDSQIRHTLRQFSSVKQVIVGIEGQGARYQAWLGAECPPPGGAAGTMAPDARRCRPFLVPAPVPALPTRR